MRYHVKRGVPGCPFLVQSTAGAQPPATTEETFHIWASKEASGRTCLALTLLAASVVFGS